MEKLNLIWSACSNNGGWRVLEESIEKILCDILRNREKFLQNFFDKVLKATKISQDEIKTAKVDIEKHNIDLVIETCNQLIPIELKVFAEDKDKQCYRYLQNARKINKNVPARLYYLTIDKKTRQPSENSLNGEKILENDLNAVGDNEGVVLISYEDEIMNWIKDCLQDLKNVGEKNFCYQLELFEDIIKEHLTKK
ncbi:MAG: PD-(D/E)XK nuclease family protein [Selenomonadaceae bacterium]|nr:PD-(D/E)XK nuclease family protein [Selenomonadaceae bacterium]